MLALKLPRVKAAQSASPVLGVRIRRNSGPLQFIRMPAGGQVLGHQAKRMRKRELWQLVNLVGVAVFRYRQRQLLVWTAGAALV